MAGKKNYKCSVTLTSALSYLSKYKNIIKINLIKTVVFFL